MKNHQGFTLIELIMVLAILSIITAFAVPNYQEYARKKDRAVAQQEMQKIAMELDRFRGKNFTYAGYRIALPDGTFADSVQIPFNQTKKTYTITVTDGNGRNLSGAGADGFAWRMSAVRVDAAAQAQNYDLLMTNTGIRCMTRQSGVVDNASNNGCGNDKADW